MMPRNHNILHKNYLLLLALVLPSPFFIKIGGAPIYVVQVFVFLLISLRILFLRSDHGFTSLDRLIYVYFCWCFLSYAINIPCVMFKFGPEKILNQTISLATMLLFVLPYYVGKYCELNDENINSFLKTFSISNLLVFSYFLSRYAKLMPNIYLARELIGQRIPMVLGLFSCILLFITVIAKPKKILYFIISCIGLILVILSLTRAAYIQIFISCVFLVLWLYRQNQLKVKSIFATIFIAVTIFLSGYSFVVTRYGVDPMLVVERFDQILHPSATTRNDESANVRVTIWADLAKNLVAYPPGLLLGYGQLGPSYIGDKFTSLYGEEISTYSAHNQYLDTLIRSGVIGLILETLIFFVVIATSFKVGIGSSTYFFKATGFALLGVLFYGFFHETLRYHMFSLFFWFYAGMVSNYISYSSTTQQAVSFFSPANGDGSDYNDR